MKKSFFLLWVCACVAWAGESSDSERWHAKMKQLSRIMPELLEDLDAPASMYSDATRERIKKRAHELSELSHEIKMETKEKGIQFAPATDPGVGFLAGFLERETKLAADAIDEGHWEYGRRVLKSVTGFCISCHTRNMQGKEFPSFDLGIDQKRMTPMERAELAAATRQFDRAFTEFRAIVVDSKFAHSQQLEWWRAFKYALGIGIRYQRDPKACLEMIEEVQKFGTPAILASRYLSAWEKSLRTWMKEGKKPSTLKEARRLYALAEKEQQYPADHSADVDFLRLTSTTHDILAQNPKPSEMAEALYLSGVAYEALDFPELWTLHESYFEKCVELVPHTEQSRRCYMRLEDSIIAGFTGSAGTSLPKEVRDRLKQLEALTSIPPRKK